MNENNEESHQSIPNIYKRIGSIKQYADMIIWSAMLLLTAGLNIYMNIHGMRWQLPSIAKFAMLFGLIIELMKLTFIYTFHRIRASAKFNIRALLLSGVVLLCTISFVDAFSFLNHYHEESTVGFTSVETELAELEKEEAKLERKMAKLDKRLSHVPQNHVTKYKNLREEMGYTSMAKRVAAIGKRRVELSTQHVTTSVDSAGIYSIARIIGQDDKIVSLVFLFALCVAIEMSSIGSLSAIIKTAGQNDQKSREKIPANAAKKRPDKKKVKKTKNNSSAKMAPNLAKLANSANDADEEQQRHDAFMQLCSTNALDLEDVRKLTGKKNIDTVVRWTTGKSVIPAKELRSLVKKVDKINLGNSFGLKNNKKHHKSQMPDSLQIVPTWMIDQSEQNRSTSPEKETIN